MLRRFFLSLVLVAAVPALAQVPFNLQGIKVTVDPVGSVACNFPWRWNVVNRTVWYPGSPNAQSCIWTKLGATAPPVPPSGVIQTCDASTVPVYAPAVCVVTLGPSELQTIGASLPAFPIIAAPGAGKVIVVSGNTASLNYIFNTVPYTGSAGFSGEYGQTLSAAANFLVSLDVSQSVSALSLIYVGNDQGPTGDSALFENMSYGVISSSTVFSTGPVTSSVLASPGNDGGVNTSQISAGGAGLLYTVGDQPTLACGAVFQVDTVDGGGAVLTYETISPAQGGGCSVGTDQPTAGGTGTGFNLDVLTVGAVYRVGDDIALIDACNIESPEGHVTSVDNNGFILSYLLDVSPGAGCSLGSGYGFQTETGLGAGASANITGIGLTGDGSVRFTLPFTVQSIN